MRSQDFGITQGISKKFTEKESLLLFEKACYSRSFEFNVKKAFDEKRIKAPIYLSVGQEFVSSALAVAFPGAAIFAQHRAHDFYLAYGGDPAALIDELLHRPTGIAGGMGGSASLHSPKINMFGHSGFMGDQIPISVGYALGSGKKVLGVMGDASAEEDYVLGALGYASHKKLPMLFVCLDNNLSILTKVEVRRNWKIVDVAAAFGMKGLELADDPWQIMRCVRELKDLPALLNVYTVRYLWHSGTGKDSEPEWDRFNLVKEELSRLGLGAKAKRIEETAQKEVDDLWAQKMNVTS